MLIHFANNFTASIFMYFNTEAASMDAEFHEIYGGYTNMYVIISVSIVVAAVCISMLNKRMKMEVEIEKPALEVKADTLDEFAE